jgi:hypothetical protein
MSRIILALLFLYPVITTAQEWDFEIQPYLMATTISGHNSIGRATGLEVDIDMSDILEVLNMAGMLHFEAIKDDSWGMAIDYAFMDLRADISGQRGGVTDVKNRQGTFQADFFYRQPASLGVIDYIAGIRWWDIDLDVSVDIAVLPGSPELNVEEDWVDLYVGARWTAPINEQWSFFLRGDIGGFGLESDFTSLVELGAKYQWRDNMLFSGSYSGLWVDYENGTEGQPGHYANDTVTHGPKLGFIYQF